MNFCPALHYKYVFKFSSSLIFIDHTIHQCSRVPARSSKQTILHCLQRLASSNKSLQGDVIEVTPNCGQFEVKGSKGKQTVDFGDHSREPRCTCKDWLTHHLPCIKHFFAISWHFPGWGWEKLPNNYLYLTLDNQVIASYVNSYAQAI